MSSDIQALKQKLIGAVRGGRVMSTGFLEPDDAASLAAELRHVDSGVNVSLEGGFTGARRRTLTVFPEHIPHASTKLSALYSPEESNELRAILSRAAVVAENIGDSLDYQEGSAVVLLSSHVKHVLAYAERHEIEVVEVGLHTLSPRNEKTQQVIVPSLRVDALGAKAFHVSRAYFGKGIDGGKVSINGKPATKASSADVGDEIYAEGLGRVRVAEVQGTTKKGNHRVLLEIERQA